MDKKAQVTLFVVISILVIVSVIVVLYLSGGIKLETSDSKNPNNFIDKCVKDALEPSVETIMKNGGRITPSLYKMYKDEYYNYLCYQKGYYISCLNTHPMLKTIVEAELKQDTQEEVEKCFSDLKNLLETQGYSVSDSSVEWSIKIVPGKVLVDIEKGYSITKEGTTSSFADFHPKLMSPLYELISVARDIVNQESQYCNFEYNGFMLLHPEYAIQRSSYDESRLYIIQDRNSQKVFKFAVRSCALPPGI